jgi:hypothetical protein
MCGPTAGQADGPAGPERGAVQQLAPTGEAPTGKDPVLATGAAQQPGREAGLDGLRVVSGSPSALLRRGPLRTRRATFTAAGSSKP